MGKLYNVYIMASRSRNLYTGMTNQLERRVYQHKRGLIPGFTRKYKIKRLVYVEAFRDVRDAIAREKQVKAWTRAKRVALIESQNPTWADLGEELEQKWVRVEDSLKKAELRKRSADPSLRSG